MRYDRFGADVLLFLALSLIVFAAPDVAHAKGEYLRPPSVLVELPRWRTAERQVVFSATAQLARRDQFSDPRSAISRARFLISVPAQWADKIDRQAPIEIRYGWGATQRQRGIWRKDTSDPSLEVAGFVDLLDGLNVQVVARLRPGIQVLVVPHRALISPSGQVAEVWTVYKGKVQRHRVLIANATVSDAEVIFERTEVPQFESVIRAGHHKTSPGRGVIVKSINNSHARANFKADSFSREAQISEMAYEK